jgi:hypothetical protein
MEFTDDARPAEPMPAGVLATWAATPLLAAGLLLHLRDA